MKVAKKVSQLAVSKTTKELILRWKEENPVDISGEVKMPQFEIFKIVPARCQETFHIGKISIYLKKSKQAEEHFDAVLLCLQALGNFDFEEKMYRVHCLKMYT